MKFRRRTKGFTLMEILVAAGVFLLFAIGIYGGISLVFKIVYISRLRILETALIGERLELVRNLSFNDVGILNGVPNGVLPYATTTVRNGVTFTLITTVRNIDDPFDGMATGTTPIDTSPADYKLVEISAICQNCPQQTPVILSTRVSPKGLEGASQNGSLFIYVFDRDGLDVVGATVSVTNTASTTPIVITDTTDNDGMVRIIDTPTGTQSYHINISKAGYSSDYTVQSSAQVPNPIQRPANVVSQSVTEIYFQIDRLGSLNLSTIDPDCSALASVPLYVYGGTKILGTDPAVYKYSQNITTDSGGDYSMTNVEWDDYYINATGTTYDIAGSIPMLPVVMTPGLTQNASIIMKAKNGLSLLVQVKDAGTGLPLSNANVRLYDATYDETIATGVGYLRQTDWSGGSGQVSFTDQTKYFDENGNMDDDSPAGDLKLKKVGGDYLTSGWLESSTFDFGGAVNYNNIIFSPLSQSSQTGDNPITFQIATASVTSGPWVYYGPDGTTSTYYTATSTLIDSSNNGNQYLRYKTFLNTDNASYTPLLSEVAITYTNTCTPPGQAYFDGLSSGTYTLEVSRSGYNTNNGTIDVTSTIQTIVNLSPST